MSSDGTPSSNSSDGGDTDADDGSDSSTVAADNRSPARITAAARRAADQDVIDVGSAADASSGNPFAELLALRRVEPPDDEAILPPALAAVLSRRSDGAAADVIAAEDDVADVAAADHDIVGGNASAGSNAREDEIGNDAASVGGYESAEDGNGSDNASDSDYESAREDESGSDQESATGAQHTTLPAEILVENDSEDQAKVTSSETQALDAQAEQSPIPISFQGPADDGNPGLSHPAEVIEVMREILNEIEADPGPAVEEAARAQGAAVKPISVAGQEVSEVDSDLSSPSHPIAVKEAMDAILSDIDTNESLEDCSAEIHGSNNGQNASGIEQLDDDEAPPLTIILQAAALADDSVTMKDGQTNESSGGIQLEEVEDEEGPRFSHDDEKTDKKGEDGRLSGIELGAREDESGPQFSHDDSAIEKKVMVAAAVNSGDQLEAQRVTVDVDLGTDDDNGAETPSPEQDIELAETPLVDDAPSREQQANGAEHSSESIPLIPEAFLVVEDGDSDNDPNIIDAYAEPLLPWWKQRRTKLLLVIIVALAVVSIVTLAVTGSNTNNGGQDTSVASSSASPTRSATTTAVPVTDQPTSFQPSTSQAPSVSPTSCAHKVAQAAQTLELPLDDPTSMKIRVDGRNAVVAARELGSDSITLVFYSLRNDNGSERWVRTEVFVESYPDDDVDDIFDFQVSLFGNAAMLGLPLQNDGAGSVNVYEQQSFGIWERAEVQLVAEDRTDQAYFGHRLDLHDGLAIVSAFNGKSLYRFQKNGVGQWVQLSKLDLSYNPYGCFFVGSEAMLAIDVASASIYLYKYDHDEGRLVDLQDPLRSNPGLKEYGSLTDQIMDTGTGKLVTSIRTSENYFVFAASTWVVDDFVSEGVFIYRRQDANEVFSLLQFLNSSDYDEDFGSWTIAPDNDILMLGGANQTREFSQQNDGLFEETDLVFDEAYDALQLSDRHMLAVTANNEVRMTSLVECTQAMPTSFPSMSAAPTSTPSIMMSLKPSLSHYPTTIMPTLSHTPSSVPTTSVAPSSSKIPSHSPTSSSSPTLCFDVTLDIGTGPSTGSDATFWELYEKESGEIIQAGGPLASDETYQHVLECLQENEYVFNITDSGDDGFGECDLCYYTIRADDTLLGGSLQFWANEVLTFPLNAEADFCSNDFGLGVTTDDNPPPPYLSFALLINRQVHLPRPQSLH